MLGDWEYFVCPFLKEKSEITIYLREALFVLSLVANGPQLDDRLANLNYVKVKLSQPRVLCIIIYPTCTWGFRSSSRCIFFSRRFTVSARLLDRHSVNFTARTNLTISHSNRLFILHPPNNALFTQMKVVPRSSFRFGIFTVGALLVQAQLLADKTPWTWCHFTRQWPSTVK